MIEINLLPKGYLKGSRGISLGKVGVYAVAGAAGVAIILAAISFYQIYKLDGLQTDIDKANQRASLLQKDIRLVDALTEVKVKISQRMAAVERLDRHRSVWVRVLSDMAGNLPEFSWLSQYTELDDNKKKAEVQSFGRSNKDEEEDKAPPVDPNAPQIKSVELEGYTFTLNALASLMINLMRSDYFDEVELKSSEETKFGEEHERAYRFVLSAKLHYLSDEDLQQKLALAQKEQADNSSRTHKALN